MADNLTPEQRHKNMTHIKSTNTKIEKDITKALWNLGYRFKIGKPIDHNVSAECVLFCEVV